MVQRWLSKTYSIRDIFIYLFLIFSILGFLISCQLSLSCMKACLTPISFFFFWRGHLSHLSAYSFKLHIKKKKKKAGQGPMEICQIIKLLGPSGELKPFLGSRYVLKTELLIQFRKRKNISQQENKYWRRLNPSVRKKALLRCLVRAVFERAQLTSKWELRPDIRFSKENKKIRYQFWRFSDEEDGEVNDLPREPLLNNHLF
jgi:hypothetical protein